MRRARGFLYLHADSRGGSTFVVADTREQADTVYAAAFDAENMRESFDAAEKRPGWIAAGAEDFVGSAVVYYPDDVELPATDIDNEDIGFAVVAGPHTADEWRLDHGMLVCPCEVCATCGGWLRHARQCANAHQPLPGDDCCEVFPSWDRLPIEVEWVPRGRRPMLFAGGWKHVRFDNDAWSLIVERARFASAEDYRRTDTLRRDGVQSASLEAMSLDT